MKGYITKGWVFILILSFFVFAGVVNAQEKVENFQVDIQINKDSSITVEENIRYSFSDSQENHGIFRNIPLNNNAGTGFVGIDVLSVQKDDSSEPYEINRGMSEMEIKIGDSDVLVSGTHNYTIEYKVKRVLNHLDDYDELYWNVVGSGWEVPIENVEASVTIPSVVDDSNLDISCYEGPVGSDQNCETSSESKEEETIISASSTGVIASGQAMTLSTSFPKGIVKEPSGFNNFMGWIAKNWIFGLPIITLIIMTLLWYLKGRDPEMGSITARYSPPEGMEPSLVGSVVDGEVNGRDITAGIIHLGQKGIISIERIETTKFKIFSGSDYKLTIKTDPESINKKNKKLLEIFFGENIEENEEVLISDVKNNTFVKTKIKKFKRSIQEEMVDLDLFSSSPRKIKSLYIFIGVAIMTIGQYIMSELFLVTDGTFFPFLSSIMVLVSGIIVFLFAFIMPKTTKKGAKVKAHILGFKEFLSMTQKERLEFHNDPEKSPEEFMEYLPYAIALEVENEWAKQFEDVYIEPPSWYGGHFGGNATSVAIANSISDFSNTAEGSVSKASSSGVGGSGFSGGGAGGGGGGSW